MATFVVNKPLLARAPETEGDPLDDDVCEPDHDSALASAARVRRNS